MRDEESGPGNEYTEGHRKKTDDSDFLIEKDSEGRFRLWFHNRLEPPVTDGDWVGVTISPRCFLYMVDKLRGVLDEMSGKE